MNCLARLSVQFFPFYKEERDKLRQKVPGLRNVALTAPYFHRGDVPTLDGAVNGTSRNRGRLLAAYMMVYYVGTFLGQLLVSKVSTELMSVLPWVTGLTLAGILPLLFTRVLNQQTENHDSTSITSMLKLRQARLGVNGCIISGIVLGSLYGLMPLYLNHKGVSNASIGFWMAVLVSAGILGQWRFALNAASEAREESPPLPAGP